MVIRRKKGNMKDEHRFRFLWCEYVELDLENSHICEIKRNKNRTYRSCIWWQSTCRYQLPTPEGAKNQ